MPELAGTWRGLAWFGVFCIGLAWFGRIRVWEATPLTRLSHDDGTFTSGKLPQISIINMGPLERLIGSLFFFNIGEEEKAGGREGGILDRRLFSFNLLLPAYSCYQETLVSCLGPQGFLS